MSPVGAVDVQATRCAPFGVGRNGRRTRGTTLVHRVRRVQLRFGKGWPWGEWDRPTLRATWLCGQDSTRPSLQFRCDAAFEVVAS